MSHAHAAGATSSPNFQLIFNNALEAYKKRTKNDLLTHPLAGPLQACDSPNDVLLILQQQVEEINQSQNNDGRLTKWLDPTVNVLYAFSGALGEGVGLVFSPAKVIFAGIGVLLLAVKDVRASQNTLIDIFERMENFFRRLEVYTEVTPTTEMTDIILKIMVEVLTILGVATKEIRQGRTKRYLMRLIGRTDIEDALKRLDKLTNEEARMATAQILNATRIIDNATRNIDNNVDQVKWNQLRENLRKWLSPPDPSTNHNIACSLRHEGSAKWFFEGSIFNDWKSTGSLLWIHGKPGSGKSVLCSTIIEDITAICKTGQGSIAYFYFDFRDTNKQHWRHLVPSLITQLSSRSDVRCDILSRLYSDYDSGAQQPGDNALTECLKEMLTVPRQCPIYLIIDAIDECPNTSGIPSPRERVLLFVKDLVDLHLPNLHICVTSRPEIDIRIVLDPLTTCQVSLHHQSGQKKDIEDYVWSVVYSDSEPIMRRWRTEDKDLVIKTLSERADGMFRWVFCQLDILRDCLPSSVRRTLNELPESLDDTYERILREIKKPHRDHARRLLQCLVVAVRPLLVEELAELIAFDFNDAEGIPKLNASWRWEDQEQALLSSCSSLIVIVGTNHSRVVQFSHFSAKEFLTSPRLATWSEDVSRYHVDLEPAHTILAQACLSVLLQLDDRVQDDIKETFPLARYASEYWVSHAQFNDVSTHVRKGMEDLFNLDKPHFSAWLQFHDIDTYPHQDSAFWWFSPYERSRGFPLYYAALCGFHDLATDLIVKNPQHVNDRGGYYVTPLVAALAGNHFQTAELLHQNGADPNVTGYAKVTPLQSAAYDGNLRIVQELIKYNADINAKGREGETAISEASRGLTLDCPNIVRLLLEHGADINVRQEGGLTPLHMASINGALEVARVLLEHGANVQAGDSLGRTPLQAVSVYRRDDSEVKRKLMTKLLVEHGAKLE